MPEEIKTVEPAPQNVQATTETKEDIKTWKTEKIIGEFK